MNKFLDFKQRKNEEEIKRPNLSYNSKYNLFNIVTKVNISSYLNDKSYNFTIIDKNYKKKEKKYYFLIIIY